MADKMSCYVLADPNKCTGCKACELACFAEHNKKTNDVGYTVGTVTVQVTPKLYLTKTETYCMPIQCKHCEDAPCLNACKKHAIYRDENGQVIVDEEKCIGCKDCVMACPFGAISILPLSRKGAPLLQKDREVVKAASKCDLCKGIEGGPACVRVCPNEALRLVDMNEEQLNKSIKTAQSLYDSRLS